MKIIKAFFLLLSASVLFSSISALADGSDGGLVWSEDKKVRPSKEALEVRLNQWLPEIQKIVEESKQAYEREDTEKALELLQKELRPKLMEFSGVVEELKNRESLTKSSSHTDFCMSPGCESSFSGNSEQDYFENKESGKIFQATLDEIKELTEEYKEKLRQKLVARWGSEFIRESLHKIHVNLRLAVFISDYYIACLKKDEKWFDKNMESAIYSDPFLEERRGSMLFSQIFCGTHITSWRVAIKEKYPLMRLYLTIANYREIGFRGRLSENKFYTESDDEASNQSEWSWFEGQKKQKRALIHYDGNKNLIQHAFPGIGLADLPSMTREEVIQAEQMYDKNRYARKILLETGQLPKELREDPQVVCSRPSPTFTVDEMINCFLEKYKELLIGNKEKRIPGLPVLGYVTSANPSDEELVEAIGKVRKNGLELLNDFREDYFIVDSEGHYKLNEDKDISFDENVNIFQFLSGRLETDYDGYKGLTEAGLANDKIMELISIGSEDYTDQRDMKLYIEMGLIIGWAVGVCGIYLRGASLLARGLCELPVGLVANAYFFVIDTQIYEESLKFAFYRPDSARPAYQDISELDDNKFAMGLSTIMLPFFTGIPYLTRHFKENPLSLKDLQKAPKTLQKTVKGFWGRLKEFFLRIRNNNQMKQTEYQSP